MLRFYSSMRLLGAPVPRLAAKQRGATEWRRPPGAPATGMGLRVDLLSLADQEALECCCLLRESSVRVPCHHSHILRSRNRSLLFFVLQSEQLCSVSSVFPQNSWNLKNRLVPRNCCNSLSFLSSLSLSLSLSISLSLSLSLCVSTALSAL